MDRRSFLTAFAALAIPVPAASTPLPPREAHRFDRATGRWVKVDLADIKVGDEVWIHDPGGEFSEVVLVSRTDVEKQEIWSEYKIDKTTNQWVIHS